MLNSHTLNIKIDDREYELRFPNEESFKRYIKEEWKYTSREYSSYSGALTIKDRLELNKKLQQARFAFAKKFGFLPTRHALVYVLKEYSDESPAPEVA